VIGIRVLAGNALSGSTERHPIASPPPEPIGSAMSYDADAGRAQRLLPLVKEGFAASLTEAATRFAISHSAVGTILVGVATPRELDVLGPEGTKDQSWVRFLHGAQLRGQPARIPDPWRKFVTRR
jgi:hypothetical protein